MFFNRDVRDSARRKRNKAVPRTSRIGAKMKILFRVTVFSYHFMMAAFDTRNAAIGLSHDEKSHEIGGDLLAEGGI